VIVPDVNLLIYAYDDESSEHPTARKWWDGLLNGREPVGLPWAVVIGFIRVITNPRAMRSPVATADAVGYVREWFRHPHVLLLNPGPMHLDYVERSLFAAGVGGNLVSDSHIAAIAMEHQAEVHSNDGDFARFPGLLWRNPL
jgi:toxin-antitoxin system PIN domain toxin